MDRFRLIAEVRERPLLWNGNRVNPSIIADSWKDVASSLGNNVTAEACKNTWKNLRSVYRQIYFDFKRREQNRLEIDKQIGASYPKINYVSKWVFYEHMHFLKDVFTQQEEAKSNTVEDSNREFENPPGLETTRDGNSCFNDNNINSRSSTPESIHYEIEIIDDSEEDKLLEFPEVKSEFLTSNDDESYEERNANQQSKVPYIIQYPNPRLSKNSTPKQKSSNNTTTERLNQNLYQNENDYMPSFSSDPNRSCYQINFIDETDQEELSKRQEREENSCSKDRESDKQPNQFLNIDNVCIKEEPVSEIENNIKDPTLSKRQRLMPDNSTPKPTHTVVRDSDDEEPITRSTNLNRQGSTDKSYPKGKPPSPQPAQILNVDIKKEPTIDNEEDLHPLLKEKSITPPANGNPAENEHKFEQQHTQIRPTIKIKQDLYPLVKEKCNTPPAKQNRTENQLKSQQNEQILIPDIKEEPVTDMEVDSNPLVEKKSTTSHANGNRTENELKTPKRQYPKQHSAPKQNSKENSDIKTNRNLSIPSNNKNSQHFGSKVQNISDSDYKFLLSFSSHLKSLTALQNLQFRVKMSDLILSFLKTSSSTNELKPSECNKQQVLAIDIRDPECNFLISFWPYMKSMNQLQNLQYRAKMSQLIIDILSKDKLSNDN